MTSWVVVVAFASGLAGCDRKPAEAAPAPAASGALGTITGVKPMPEDHAASSLGPSDGSTAVGGLAGGEGTGAHPAPPQGNTPAPTAGDGAASAASR